MSLYVSALFAFAGVWLAPPAQRWSTSKSMSTGRIMEAIAVKEGGTVCEIGAGNGASTIAAARIVGPAGHAETVAREMKDAGLEATSSELPERRWFMVVLAKPGAGD
jgi:protein-L-isoaspartate O-methyltransferase